MTALSIQTTVGQFVADRPSRSRMFQNLGIDFCCGGKKSLEEACNEKNLDAQAILDQILAVEQSDNSNQDFNPANLTLTELCDHIVNSHHDYLRVELPRLGAMAQRVAHVHGQHYTWTIQIDHVFTQLADELTSHMHKEEQILFPMIRSMEAGEVSMMSHCGGSISNPIRVMESEHDDAGQALEQINRLSNGYIAPQNACNTFRALLDGLRELELDMHHHVHKENSILFPKAIALENAVRSS